MMEGARQEHGKDPRGWPLYVILERTSGTSHESRGMHRRVQQKYFHNGHGLFRRVQCKVCPMSDIHELQPDLRVL